MTNRIGQQLGNYTLTRVVGQGGFAEVYLGEHVYLKVPAAIKVLHTQLSAQEDINGFLREAQFVARLSHPNIVRVLDFGIVEHVPFLVMDYAPNGTLRQRYPRGTRLPLATVVLYIKQVASALQYAHDERVVHRDIKPENILLGRHDEVLLSDFGIALVAQSSRYQGAQDIVGGTAAYMSPEQIQGKSRPACDQYSLAIVAYEWLTGGRPFQGSFTELCAQHLFAPVPPIREKVPDIPVHVEQVIMTALAKDGKQRFGSVRAFATALEQASRVDGPPALASQVQPPHVAPQLPVVVEQTPQTPSSSDVPAAQQKTPLAPQSSSDTPPVQQKTPLAPPSSSDAPPVQQTPPSLPVPSMLAATEEPVKPAAAAEKRPGGWGIGKDQIIALLVGVVLYANASAAFDAVINNNPDDLSLTATLSLCLIIALFVSTKFGPWVGFIVPFVGSLAPARLLFHYSISSMLPFSIVTGLSGFVAGLAFVGTRGNYRGWKAIVFAMLTSLLALVVVGVGDNIIESGSSLALIARSGVITLVLLPVILLLTNLLGRPVSQQARQ